MRRRNFIVSLVLTMGSIASAKAKVIWGGMPWTGKASPPPTPVIADGWKFFRPDEALLVEAIADRLIPADALSIGGREAGCAVFIDSQLAGSYGQGATLYRAGPFKPGTPQQGPQGRQTPAERYRLGLAAFAAYVESAAGKLPFGQRTPDEQDAFLRELEAGSLPLHGAGGAVDGKAFFSLMLTNVREGFFSDPIYGGNKDMAGWKMLGFPGAQYDFRDAIGKRGAVLEIKPVSLIRSPREKA